MTRQYTYEIKRIQDKDADRVCAFIGELLTELFPMVDHNQLPLDILDFKTYYLERDGAAL